MQTSTFMLSDNMNRKWWLRCTYLNNIILHFSLSYYSSITGNILMEKLYPLISLNVGTGIATETASILLLFTWEVHLQIAISHSSSTKRKPVWYRIFVRSKNLHIGILDAVVHVYNLFKWEFEIFLSFLHSVFVI